MFKDDGEGGLEEGEDQELDGGETAQKDAHGAEEGIG